MADERIGLAIEATNRSAAVLQTVKNDVNAVAVEAQRAGVASSASATQQVASWQKVAPAVIALRAEINSDIVALQNLAKTAVVTSEAERVAFRSAAAAQRELMVSVGATAEQFRKLDATVAAFDRQAAKFTPASPLPAGLQVTSSRTKEAGNQMAALSMAMTGGDTSARGLATSLSGVAGATLSLQTRFPALAAQAFGVAGAIAAVVGVMGALYEAYKKFSAALPEGDLSEFQRGHIASLKDIATVNREIAIAQEQRADTEKLIGRGDSKAAERATELDAVLSALSARKIALIGEEKDAELKAIEASRKARIDAATETLQLRLSLAQQVADITARGAMNQWELQRRTTELEFAEERRRIEGLRASEEEKDAILNLAHQRRKLRLAETAAAEAKAAAEAAAADLAKQKQAEEAKKALWKSRISYFVRSQESIAKAALRMALDPIIGELEGLAISEGAKAIASLPNLPLAALHTAGAAAALMAARQVAQLAGGGGRGVSSGGGAGAGAAASGTTFEPRGGQGAGSLNLTIITRDLYGRESIAQTAYELERSRILKRPIPVTGGLLVVPG